MRGRETADDSVSRSLRSLRHDYWGVVLEAPDARALAEFAWRGSRGSLCLVGTKTRASAAAVPAPDGLMKALARHRVQQNADRLAFGAVWPSHDLVFTSTVGTPLEPRNVSRTWGTVRREAGLPTLRLHDLRHTCATLLAALGVHPRVIMEMLRHSQISVTMNVYAHVSSTLQRDAADALNDALFG